RRDVVTSIPDVIASTANNLKKDGWAPGQTWGYEVAVPQGFDYLLADRSRQFTLAQWEKLGLRRPGGQPFTRPGDRAYLLVSAGARGPGFLMLNNFRVIMKYNPAEAYALAIGHLADRLRGGEPPRTRPALLAASGSNLCRFPDAYFAGLRHQEQGEHQAHRGNRDRVEQRVADAARGLEGRRGDERHQSAAPAVADVIRHRN